MHLWCLSLLLSWSTADQADLILTRGKIVTVDPDLGEAQALAVKDERILAVGSSDEIDQFRGEATRVIDLQGRLAIPGFIEGHGHFTGVGQSMMNLDLMQVRSWEDVVSLVTEAVAQASPGEWILGRGWHQEKWDRVPEDSVEGFPVHDSVSAVSPDNPVCLTHASGHACFFNAKAMEMAGVDASTPDPAGGEILRDGHGNPTGVFREKAAGLVQRVHARSLQETNVRERIRRAARLADQECLENGITSFQDAGSSFETIDVLREMVEAGEIGTRLWVMVRESNDRLAASFGDYLVKEAGNHHLTVAAIKRSIDGALGSRGAWLLEPYSDLPGSSGLNTATVEDVIQTAAIARKHGVQLCVHAIGDRANREVLDIFENSFPSPERLAEARWRVEHAQHLAPKDIPRFAEMGVIASMQGVHCTSDAPYVVARLGSERAEKGAYVWQKLIQSGAVVTNGTDAPVEDVSPIQSFYSTVSRMTRNGDRFFPEQRMTREQALRSYTICGAHAAFEESIKGTLTPKKLADIVVLSQDLLTCPEERIPETQVDLTIVGGQVLYQRL